MKYKVGDKVRIVSERKGGPWNVSGKMDHWLGKTMTICIADGYRYHMEEDRDENCGGWAWTDEMIAGLATKYQVGDKVKVRDDLEQDKEYYTADGNGMDDVVEEMLEFTGKTVTIESMTGSGKYRLKEDTGHWNWTDGMFAGLACEQKIVITSDGVTTLARLYEGSKVVKSAEAKCSPDDEFKFEIGAKLAMERLYTPEPKFKIGDRVKHRRWGVGTVIAIDNDGDFGVEFDKESYDLHSCGKRGKVHHCWWCMDDALKAYVAPKFKKGDWVRVIDKPTTGAEGIIHGFDIGDVVKIHSVDSDGSYYCQRPYDKLEQFVSAKDVESPKK